MKSKDLFYSITRIDGTHHSVQRWSKNYHHRIGKPLVKENIEDPSIQDLRYIKAGTIDEVTFFDGKKK